MGHCEIEVLHDLTENKRLCSGTVEDCVDANWLLKVGNGSANSVDNDIQLEPTIKCGDSIDSLFSAIYPGLNTLDSNADNDEWFSNRTILCLRNNSVDELNLKGLNVLKRDIHTFRSADKAEVDESEVETSTGSKNVRRRLCWSNIPYTMYHYISIRS